MSPASTEASITQRNQQSCADHERAPLFYTRIYMQERAETRIRAVNEVHQVLGEIMEAGG